MISSLTSILGGSKLNYRAFYPSYERLPFLFAVLFSTRVVIFAKDLITIYLSLERFSFSTILRRMLPLRSFFPLFTQRSYILFLYYLISSFSSIRVRVSILIRYTAGGSAFFDIGCFSRDSYSCYSSSNPIILEGLYTGFTL